MRSVVLTLVAIEACFALQASPIHLSKAQMSRPRATSIVLGEQSTKKENEWKYVKSVNDFGKEQTYMYLAERSGDANGPSAGLGRGLIDLGDWSFLTAPYFILLFTPFALCAVAILGGFV